MSKQNREPITVIRIGVATENGQKRGAIADGTRALLEKVGYRPIGRASEPASYRVFMSNEALPTRSGAEVILNVYAGPATEILEGVESGKFTAAVVRPESLAMKNTQSRDLELPGVFAEHTVRASIVTGENIKPEVLTARNFAQSKTTEEKLLTRLAITSRKVGTEVEEIKAGQNFTGAGEELGAWRYN